MDRKISNLIILLLTISFSFGFPGQETRVRRFTESMMPMIKTISSNYINGLANLFVKNNFNQSAHDIMNNYKRGKSCEDVYLNIEQLVVKYGHSIERHNTLTEDGYNLTMFRIPNNGSVVFLMHGMGASADGFIVGGPNVGLAYLLAREGYDVWLGNSRGNKHSRSHIELDPSQEKFWEFSWHEIGYYDLPAMIDYTLNATGQERLKYIGHSQGTTSFFVLASERPDYNNKISVMVALSPVAFLSNIKSPVVRLMAYFNREIYAWLKQNSVYELVPNGKHATKYLRYMLGNNPMSEPLSSILIVSFFSDTLQMNFTNIPVIVSHEPSGSSMMSLFHYGQIIESKKFRRLEYDVEENLKRYGSRTPPVYKLNKITTPVALIYSDGDVLLHPKDVDKLSKKLPNVIKKYKVKYKMFNHFDYLFSMNLEKLVFKTVKNVLARY